MKQQDLRLCLCDLKEEASEGPISALLYHHREPQCSARAIALLSQLNLLRQEALLQRVKIQLRAKPERVEEEMHS